MHKSDQVLVAEHSLGSLIEAVFDFMIAHKGKRETPRHASTFGQLLRVLASRERLHGCGRHGGGLGYRSMGIELVIGTPHGTYGKDDGLADLWLERQMAVQSLDPRNVALCYLWYVQVRVERPDQRTFRRRRQVTASGCLSHFGGEQLPIEVLLGAIQLRRQQQPQAPAEFSRLQIWCSS